MPPSNGHPNHDRNPVPGSHSRNDVGEGERDRLDAAREHARKKILDRLIEQAMADLQDPAVLETLPIDVEGEAAKLAPSVMDAVKHRLMDRIASDVVQMISTGDGFRAVVDEAARRTETQLSKIAEQVVGEVTSQLSERVAGMLSDTSGLAARIESTVDKDSAQLTDVAHAVCGRIEESIKAKAIDMAGNADVTPELIQKRIPEDHPVLEQILAAVHGRVLDDLVAKAAMRFDDAESAAAAALQGLDRESDALKRVRELLAEELLVMVMGDALDDLGRKLASTGPRDSMLDRVFQSLTSPARGDSPRRGAGIAEPEPVPQSEPEPIAQPEPAPEPELEPSQAEQALAAPEPEAPVDELREADAEVPLSPESVESIVSELEFESVSGSVEEAPTGKAARNAPQCYVYGVVRSEDWAELDQDLPEGVEEGSLVRTLAGGRLMAVVSDVPAGLYGSRKEAAGGDGADWTRTRLRRHARVLGQIGHRITVLPLPFGTVFASEGEVKEMLTLKAKEHAATLERLNGRVEWTVRMVRDDYRMLERMVDLLDADGMDLSSLPDDVASELDAALAECDDPGKMMSVVTSQCVAHARAHLDLYADSSVDRRSGSDAHEDASGLNRAYLVPRDGAAPFRKALESLAAQWSGLGLGFEVSGPWPPYHFAEGSFE
jgi:cell division septation protein DedD